MEMWLLVFTVLAVLAVPIATNASNNSLDSSKTKKEINSIRSCVRKFPEHIRSFSNIFNSLYIPGLLDSNIPATHAYENVRDETRDIAVAYQRTVLPITRKFIIAIQEFFEFYTSLSYDEWDGFLPDIVEETKKSNKIAKLLVKIHEEIISLLIVGKSHIHTASVTIRNAKQLLHNEINTLQSDIDVHHILAGLSWLPHIKIAHLIRVGVTAFNLIEANRKIDEKRLLIPKVESTERVLNTIKSQLLPAMLHLTNAIKNGASFFAIMSSELEMFSERGNKAIDERKRLHFVIMNKKGSELIDACRSFYGVLPQINADLTTISKHGINKKFMENWIETIRNITKQFVPSILGKRLLKGITGKTSS